MTNEKIMEEVLHKAHYEGIYELVIEKAKILRNTENLPIQDSYIKAYYSIDKKVIKKS